VRDHRILNVYANNVVISDAHRHELSVYSPNVTKYDKSMFGLSPQCREGTVALDEGPVVYCMTLIHLDVTVRLLTFGRPVMCYTNGTNFYFRLLTPYVRLLCGPHECHYIDDFCFAELHEPRLIDGGVLDLKTCLRPYIDVWSLLVNEPLVAVTNASVVKHHAAANFFQHTVAKRLYCKDGCNTTDVYLPTVELEFTTLTYTQYIQHSLLDRFEHLGELITRTLHTVTLYYRELFVLACKYVLRQTSPGLLIVFAICAYNRLPPYVCLIALVLTASYEREMCTLLSLYGVYRALTANEHYNEYLQINGFCIDCHRPIRLCTCHDDDT